MSSTVPLNSPTAIKSPTRNGLLNTMIKIAPTVVELGQIKNRLNLQIKELLDKEGFELAYNSATVYLEQETEGKDQ